ncbi:MAG: helix-turn-helix transcriptional regulator [Opitutales bacterium]
MPAKRQAPLSRPPLTRMVRIHRALKGDSSPNATQLARQLETSTKTIHRDIATMRDQLGLPIEWDAQENGYFYAKDVDAFPLVQVTEGELFALLVAQKAIEPYRDTPFHEPLRQALEKLSDSLKETMFLSLDRLEAPISFKPTGVSTAAIETFQLVTRALTEQVRLKFEYKGLTSNRWMKRHIDPYHLGCVADEWYLIGYDHLRKAMRTFALVRMRQPVPTGENFQKPADFDIRKHLKDAFGVFVTGKKHKIRIHFDAFAARLIREKTWHPQQELIDQPDGAVEFRIELADLFEIERWILSWGSHATVLAPVALRKSVRGHAQAILDQTT